VGNEFDEDSTSCEGDSGSPVIRRISGTARGKPYYQQEYVVSTGLDCNLKATIYARVSNREILTWIQKVTDTSPLVVVIGGYTSFEYKKKKLVPKVEAGPDNDIEILSSTT
jgi:secreted trypsin-like serine protease